MHAACVANAVGSMALLGLAVALPAVVRISGSGEVLASHAKRERRSPAAVGPRIPRTSRAESAASGVKSRSQSDSVSDAAGASKVGWMWSRRLCSELCMAVKEKE